MQKRLIGGYRITIVIMIIGCINCVGDYCISNEGNCDNDNDGDNINDITEFELAGMFAPQMVFSSYENYSAYNPHWAVKTFSINYISIIYLYGYYEDGGDMESGWPGHLGDPEFIVVDIEEDEGTWSVSEIFLSAHYNSGEIWDSSGWYGASSFSWTSFQRRSHPVVWISNWKHANYTDRNSCDEGAMWFDWCDEGWREIFRVWEGSNLGSRENPLIDRVNHNGGNIEYFWSNSILPFCGWQVSTESASERDAIGCSNISYDEILRRWDNGTL